MIVSRVVIGTVTVWIVVPSENDVALLKDAVVFNGCKVEKDCCLKLSAASIRAVGLSVTNG